MLAWLIPDQALAEPSETVAYLRIKAINPITNLPEERTGSGFLVSGDGFILTAAHLLEGDPSGDDVLITLGGKSGSTFTAASHICSSTKVIDVCLLKLVPPAQGFGIDPIRVDCRVISTADRLTSLGFIPGDNPVLSIDAKLTGGLGGNFKFPSDPQSLPGMDGGPVIDSSGSAVALNAGSVDVGGREVTFFQPLAHATELLKLAQVACEPTTNDNEPAKPEDTKGSVEIDAPLPEAVDISMLPGDRRAVDIVLVVDDSSSMKSDQLGFASALISSLKTMQAYGIEFRLCVTTTDVKYYKGRPLRWGTFANGKFDGLDTYLDRTSTDVERKVAETISYLGAQWSSDERAIAALNLMTSHYADSGCFRRNGLLLAIVLSDEDERSVGGFRLLSDQQYQPMLDVDRPDILVERVRSIFADEKRFLWNSVIVLPDDPDCEGVQDANASPSFRGRTYALLSDITGGFQLSICDVSDVAWFSNDLTLSLFSAMGYWVARECYWHEDTTSDFDIPASRQIDYFVPNASNEVSERLFAQGCEALYAVTADEADRLLREFVEAAPDDRRAPEAVLWIGRIKMQAGDYKTANEIFDYGLERYPVAERTPDLHLSAAVSLIQLNRNNEACDHLKAIARMPQMTDFASEFADLMTARADTIGCQLPRGSIPG